MYERVHRGKIYIYDAASTSLKFSVNNNCV